MSCNWPEYTIDDLKAKTKGAIAMGPFGSRIKAENFVDSGVPVLKGGNLHGAYIDDNECDFLTEEKADELKSSVVYEGDIVITHRGTIGQVSIVSDESKYPRYVVSQSQLKISLDRARVNPYYVNYYLRSHLGQHQLLSFASQVGVPAIAKASTSVKQIRIPCPSLSVQERIVDFIRVLDRKLSNNSAVNQTLEGMAQAIFKSWFVDFDPVKAKMNGEQPEGMDEATASLFPEKLVESELGLIPEGWEVSSLSELIKLTGGGTPKRSEETYWGGDIPWFSVKDVPSGSNVFVVDTDEKITELGLNKSSTKLLPKGTTIITARGTVGKLALVGTDMCMNQSCYGIRGKEVGDYYNYFNLKQAVSTLQQNTHGAVFDTITTKTFDTYSLAFGGVELADKFDALIAPLLQKIEANVRQNIELSALRDTLLPKLLSGEIELGQTEEMVEVN
jgi:type I restriction enzyme, S subunit